MIELLQLIETGIVFTAVTLTVVTAPVSVITDVDLPDLEPLIEHLADKNKDV